jgi:hypothetical protein
MLRPGRCTLGEEPVPTVYGAKWAPGLVWTGAENLAPSPTNIQFQDHSAISELV